MMDPTQFKDYYKILGLSPNADQGEIKKTFRRLAREFHPDVNKAPESERRFKDISAAYDILGDAEKRREYDTLYQYMQNGGPRSRPGARPETRGQQGFVFEFDPSGTSPEIEEIFNRFFGQKGMNNPFSRARSGGFPFFGGGLDGDASCSRSQRSGPSSCSSRSRKPETRLEITLEEAYQGCKRSIDLHTPQGNRQILVTVPPGMLDGQTLRIGGGGRGSDFPQGEVLLAISILPHRWFRLSGRDVELDLPLSPWEAALGCQVTVPTLGGQVRMRIPENSQSGKRLALRGKGLPGSPPGDQTVVLKMVIPEARSPEQIEAYQRFSREFSFDPRQGLF
ncbi:MAG: DnaJ domain-containing protein [Magnetococcales bacterium]|nr:DnaJ domain-containing protein [Magnetococcales bacterium]